MVKNGMLAEFGDYIRRLELSDDEVKIGLHENVINNNSLEFDIQIYSIMNRKFICVMKCIESEPEKIYFDIYGIGRIKEMSTGLLIQLNLCNEICDDKVFIDKENNLVMRSFTTIQSVGEEQCEWILGAISMTLAHATIVYENLISFL